MRRAVTLTTAKLKVEIERESGRDSLCECGRKAADDGLVSHAASGRGERGEDISCGGFVWRSTARMKGCMDWGSTRRGCGTIAARRCDLSQENTEIAVPLLVSSNGYGIFWNNPSRSEVNNRFVHWLYLTAEVADRVDYYFLYGPEADDIIGQYRELTGEVPLFGRWAYGFWQCKNKYQSQKEVEGVAAKYRALHIPVDNIVQDWFWWVTMGEMKWNQNYPDPQGMIDTLHKEHFHLMVSVWPYFRPGSAVYDQFDKNGWFVAKTQVGGISSAGAGAV